MKGFNAQGDLALILRREWWFCWKLLLAFAIGFTSIQMCRTWILPQYTSAPASGQARQSFRLNDSSGVILGMKS